jgi:Ca2+-binding EF-hand superfamily protein
MNTKYRSMITATIAVCGLAGATVLSSTAWSADAAAIMSKADSDNDKTLDLNEVKTAAGAKFDALDKDQDGTVDANEVKGLIGAKTFKAADPDNDGKLDKNEYLALVEKLFKKADVDGDGTLDVKELRSKNAHLLRKLIR